VSFLIGVGVLFIAAGLLGYTGVWRRWSQGGERYFVFAFVWLGVGWILLGLVDVPTDPPMWLLIAAAAFIVGGAMSAWWMPAAMTPGWFRELRHRTGAP
jgi:hypothetical protein